MDNIVFLSLFFNVLILILLFVVYRKTGSSNQTEQLLGIKLQLDQLRNDIYRQQEGLRSELNRNMQETMNNFGSIILKTFAHLTLPARIPVLGVKAIERVCKNFCRAGFACSTRSIKQICVRMPAGISTGCRKRRNCGGES